MSGPETRSEVVHRPQHGLTTAGLYQRVGHPTPEGLQQIVATPDVPETLRAWAARQIRLRTAGRQEPADGEEVDLMGDEPVLGT